MCSSIKATGWTHNFRASIFGTCSPFYIAISKFLCLLLQQWVQCGGRVIEQAGVCAVYLEWTGFYQACLLNSQREEMCCEIQRN